MELFSNTIFILLLIGYGLFEVKKHVLHIQTKYARIFFGTFTILHFSIAFLFALYLDDLTTITDPHHFYNEALNSHSWINNFGFGHNFLIFLIIPFVKLLISKKVLFLFFSTISFKGFLVYFKLLHLEKITIRTSVFCLLFFLPTLHFWTSMLGKDALIFLFLALFLNAIVNKQSIYVLLIISLLVFLCRPHVFFVLFLSYSMIVLFSATFSKSFKKRYFYFVLFVCVLLSVISVRYFLKSELDLDAILSRKDMLVSYFHDNSGGSSMKLFSKNYFFRIFYLLLMPFPFLFEFTSSTQYLVAFENVWILGTLIYAIFSFFKSKKHKIIKTFHFKFAFLFLFMMILMLAIYVNNLGYWNRLRVMFFPYFIYLLIKIFYNFKSDKKNILQ